MFAVHRYDTYLRLKAYGAPPGTPFLLRFAYAIITKYDNALADSIISC